MWCNAYSEKTHRKNKNRLKRIRLGKLRMCRRITSVFGHSFAVAHKGQTKRKKRQRKGQKKELKLTDRGRSRELSRTVDSLTKAASLNRL